MVANVEQIQNGIKSFIENELAKKATGFRKFGIYFIMPALDKQIVDYLGRLKSLVPDFFTDNGDVKVDDLYNTAKMAVQKSGQFEFMGVIFNETDIDKLYTYIKGTTIL